MYHILKGSELVMPVSCAIMTGCRTYMGVLLTYDTWLSGYSLINFYHDGDVSSLTIIKNV